MTLRALWTSSVAISCLARSVVAAPPLAVDPAQASAFMGTWVIAMTNPQGATQTVKIWDQNGVVAASVQLGRFPPHEVTGTLKDGEMLVLTHTVFENGKPIRSVVSLTLNGDIMNLAQMLEFSETIKRGVARRQQP
jgi:hypothetical protein